MFDRKVAVGAPRVMDLAEDRTHRSATVLFCFLTVTLIMSENVCKCLKYPACGHYNLIMSPPQGRKIIFDTLNFFKKIVILKHLRCRHCNIIMSQPQGRNINFDILNFFKKIVILKHLRCRHCKIIISRTQGRNIIMSRTQGRNIIFDTLNFLKR